MQSERLIDAKIEKEPQVIRETYGFPEKPAKGFGIFTVSARSEPVARSSTRGGWSPFVNVYDFVSKGKTGIHITIISATSGSAGTSWIVHSPLL